MFKRSILVVSVLALGACGDDGDKQNGGSAGSHKDVATILGAGGAPAGACSIASCHGSSGVADLSLTASANLRDTLVGVPACEVPGMNLVEPGDPERSWLWIKLTGKMTSAQNGDLEADPSWGEPGKGCGAIGFGKRMPRVAPYSLSQAQLDQVRAWILAGAPGP